MAKLTPSLIFTAKTMKLVVIVRIVTFLEQALSGWPITTHCTSKPIRGYFVFRKEGLHRKRNLIVRFDTDCKERCCNDLNYAKSECIFGTVKYETPESLVHPKTKSGLRKRG